MMNKKKNCAYCRSNPSLLGSIVLDYTEPVTVYADISGRYLTLSDDKRIEDIPINFCPMCGRDLRRD